MDHLDVEGRGLVEKYVLEELTESEAEEFETHYFDCLSCYEQLMRLGAFKDNAKAVFIEQLPTLADPPRQPWWRRIFGRRAK